MFYRRKIVLALLQIFEGKLDKLKLQKLLFLLTQRQQKKSYDFVPYKYGCHSFSLAADIDAMQRKGLVSLQDKTWQKTDRGDYFNSLTSADQQFVRDIKNLYGKMDANALMKHTYINFPYWALKSEVASKLLDKTQMEKVQASVKKDDAIVLFTIGYEGISLEEYLNRLIRNDVKVLVDVRRNPLSMKYGFSKTILKKFCENLGVKYMHFPEVGIESDQRQKLNTQKDYDELFERYKFTNLIQTKGKQSEILSLLKQYKRIALTCFEADICQCHRKHLAESIASDPAFKYELKHI